MVLIGIALFLSFNVNKMVGDLENQNVILVFFDDYNAALYSEGRQIPPGAEVDENGICDQMYTVHNTDEAKAVCEELKKIDNVNTVEFISKETALEMIKDILPEKDVDYFAVLEEAGENPMSDGAKVTMVDLEKFDATVSAITSTKGVDSIQSQNGLAEKITGIKNGIFIAGIAIITILLIISLVIVSNTIRVTMYNRKLEISIMKAVGATDSFVRIPFVVEGVSIGIISALLSLGVLYCCYRVAVEAILSAIGSYTLIPFSSQVWLLLGVFVAIGVVAGSLGSIIMIGKYLKREGSEFAAI
jgi:cell division transport system permease protein